MEYSMENKLKRDLVAEMAQAATGKPVAQDPLQAIVDAIEDPRYKAILAKQFDLADGPK
jgi:hypothetical protein